MGFSALYFELLTNEIEGKHTTQTCQAVNSFVKTVKTAGVQCISLVSGIMNSKNASKEIVKARIDMAKGLMDENQQPSVQREHGDIIQKDCSLVQEVERGEVKADSFIGLVQVNHLLLQQLIQILVLQHRLPQQTIAEISKTCDDSQ